MYFYQLGKNVNSVTMVINMVINVYISLFVYLKTGQCKKVTSKSILNKRKSENTGR